MSEQADYKELSPGRLTVYIALWAGGSDQALSDPQGSGSGDQRAS